MSVDARLAAWDYAIWGANPTVWLERIQTPLVTELIQITYSLFVPMFLAVAVIFWIRNRRYEFRSYAFVLALGFLVSYVGYVCVPARGPRFYLDGLQTQPLAGCGSTDGCGAGWISSSRRTTTVFRAGTWR